MINGAGGTVSITSTAGAITDANDPPDGTLNITALNLSMSAATGVGGTGATATLETQVGNLEAQTTTGGIFIDNIGDLTIGGVTGALDGVRVVTSGDIALTNAGRIDINVAGERVRGPAAVTITANGAAADILTGDNAATPSATVESTGGTVTLNAGRDLLLGDTAGAGTLGNVFGGGSVVLDAVRDIIVDTGTFVMARGAGTITANAGRDISVIDTSGRFDGAEIRTEGGDITLTTGAGGVFTADNSFSPAVQTTVFGGNGNITINADDIVIQNSIQAGTGIVTLRPRTAGREIDLGTDTATSLALTDAELDLITASILRIGSTTAGSITFNDLISPALTDTLSLITGDQILDDHNINAADVQVANLALQSVNGIANNELLETLVDTVAALNTTDGGIAILERFAGGDLIVGTVDGVVGLRNEATGANNVFNPTLAIQLETTDGNLTVNDDIYNSRRNIFLVAQQGNGGAGDSLFTNNANIVNGDGGSNANNAQIDIRANNMTLATGSTISAANR
ncbi:MAG: hypothetical protein R3F53_21690 [Gammaproteobacteria bacterium]